MTAPKGWERAEDQERTIAELMEICTHNWKNPYFGARPYIEALSGIESRDPNARFGYEDAKGLILYFLSNATAWRGETAREVKAELKKIAGVK